MLSPVDKAAAVRPVSERTTIELDLGDALVRHHPVELVAGIVSVRDASVAEDEAEPPGSCTERLEHLAA